MTFIASPTAACPLQLIAVEIVLSLYQITA